MFNPWVRSQTHIYIHITHIIETTIYESHKELFCAKNLQHVTQLLVAQQLYQLCK